MGRSAAARLQSNLTQILDHTGQMLGALENERKALAANDIPALDEAGVLKAQLADALERLDRIRTDLVCSHSAESQRPETMAALIQACDADGALTTLWTRVQETVSQCDTQNQVNGAALRARRESVSRALSLLHGAPPENSNVYDQQGKAEAASLGTASTTLGRV